VSGETVWRNRVRSTDPEFLVNCERITQEVDQLTARHAVRSGHEKFQRWTTAHHTTDPSTVAYRSMTVWLTCTAVAFD